MDLDPDKKDALGLPVIRVTYSLGDNEVKAGTYIDEKMDEMLKAAGATETWPGFPAGIPVPINSHAYGGTRMGTDDTAAVVDKYGIAFESTKLRDSGRFDLPGKLRLQPDGDDRGACLVCGRLHRPELHRSGALSVVFVAGIAT